MKIEILLIRILRKFYVLCVSGKWKMDLKDSYRCLFLLKNKIKNVCRHNNLAELDTKQKGKGFYFCFYK